jgi:hypothetical protein
MKKFTKTGAAVRAIALSLAVLSCAPIAKAIPFASGVTNITLGGSNYVQFIMNEATSGSDPDWVWLKIHTAELQF